MTYETIFDEHDDSIEVKKLRKENNQLKKTIDTLETDIGIKDWHINKLKEEIKELKEALEKTEQGTMRNLFETFIDVGSGLFLSTLIQLYIFPFFDLHPTVLESFHIAVIFTAISMIRSWCWRTIFARRKT